VTITAIRFQKRWKRFSRGKLGEAAFYGGKSIREKTALGYLLFSAREEGEERNSVVANRAQGPPKKGLKHPGDLANEAGGLGVVNDRVIDDAN